jgi:simple sugar transport system permease protein
VHIKIKKKLIDIFSQKASSIIIITIIMQILCILFVPRYTSVINLQILLRAIPELGIISVGVCLLMISGEFDLSVGSTFALTALLMNALYKFGLNIWLSFLINLIIGGLFGTINGLITLKTNIPSFIATLGTMMIWRGLVLILSGGHVKHFLPDPFFHSIFAGQIGGFMQAQFVWFVIIAIIFWLILEGHKFGNAIFATGGNKKAAIEIGVNPNRVKLVCFIIVGTLVSVSSCIGMTRVTSISPLQGRGLELQAVAAVVIGGTNLRGGEGTVLGACLGAMVIYTIQNALLLLRAPGFYFEFFLGIFIVLAVILKAMIKTK